MTERVSQAEAARRFGVSRQSFNELVTRGVIPLFEGKVDLDVADAIIKKRLDPGRSKILQTAADRVSATAATALPDAPPAVAQPPSAPANPPAEPPPNDGITSYHVARTLREKYAALDARVRFEQLCGTLVAVDEVRRVVTGAAASLRQALDSVPDQLSTRLAAEPDADVCHAMLRTALDDALASLADLDQALLVQPQDAA